MIATITPRAEMVRNWQRDAPPPRPANTGPPPRALNLQNVLDLGNLTFFTFRGRAYGIPPLAWRQAELLLDCWLEIQRCGAMVNRENFQPYFRCMQKLQDLIWANCQPDRRWDRLLRWIGFYRNPFRKATEGELAQLAVFFLGRRMIGLPVPEPADYLRVEGTS